MSPATSQEVMTATIHVHLHCKLQITDIRDSGFSYPILLLTNRKLRRHILTQIHPVTENREVYLVGNSLGPKSDAMILCYSIELHLINFIQCIEVGCINNTGVSHSLYPSF
jgi:hypothetical protein